MSGTNHAALMDQVYRRQRYIYDVTRKYYLLGRDGLIADLQPEPGQRVLEMGCGTGRNLILAARMYPQAEFFGIDISTEMLETATTNIARAGLAGQITLKQADATRFSAPSLFGVDGFDRTYFSYTLSMVPDWRAALDQALEATLPEGRLHIIDFGQQAAMPAIMRSLLRRWLALFHVDPQAEMAAGVAAAAEKFGRPVGFTPLYRDYSWSFQVGAASGR
ncbi:class I SAM-dependent methyltransferase [Rhodobacteraceae bacterium NNCM2]|nr:class I SAM-dependent methyltransferase [Coraliihabitans acroporae]